MSSRGGMDRYYLISGWYVLAIGGSNPAWGSLCGKNYERNYGDAINSMDCKMTLHKWVSEIYSTHRILSTNEHAKAPQHGFLAQRLNGQV